MSTIHQAAESYAFGQLVKHLQMRHDVQNIDVMILAGFCRNCLSKWYHAGLVRLGVESTYEQASERVYGMPISEWKKSYQTKASEEQMRRLEETSAGHAKHEKPVAMAPAAPPSPARLLSDVCCTPADELAPPVCEVRMLPPPVRSVRLRVGVLTVSDRAAAGVYSDESGPEVQRCLAEYASGPGAGCWGLEVGAAAVVPDEQSEICARMMEWSDGAAPCNLILTTGGSGIAPRDVTPEATLEVVQRPLPGISELLLREALKVEPLAALSRAAAGVRGRTLIVNLPGRPKAVRENLAVLMPLLAHAIIEMEREA